MWYRIELHKDGSVAHCVEAEGSRDGSGRHVFYVEANSKVAALRLAADKYRSRLADEKRAREAVRERKEKAGLCRECSREREPGKLRCSVCLKKRSSGAKSIRRREPAGRLGGPGKEKDYSVVNARIALMALEEASDAYDQDRPNFRAWLERRMNELKALLSGKAA